MSHADRLLELARECRQRGEEILARPENFHDADAREGMRRIAEDYEKLAERLEKEGGSALTRYICRRTFGPALAAAISDVNRT
jgi:hypothetical protein